MQFAKTTPIQRDSNLETQPPYGRRVNSTIIGGKPSALANSFGLQFFTDDNGGGNANTELEQGEIPPARLRAGLAGSSAAVTLSSGAATANRLHSSGPCCALPFPVTQAHNIGERIYYCWWWSRFKYSFHFPQKMGIGLWKPGFWLHSTLYGLMKLINKRWCVKLIHSQFEMIWATPPLLQGSVLRYKMELANVRGVT